MAEKCFKIIIRGNVQGVFFRKYTKVTADKLGIKGFVRNELDTSVYIEAFGESNKLEEFIKWCHRGPEHAEVEKVEVIEIPIKKFLGFTIEYF